MGQRRSSSRPISEPIRSPWLWVTFVVLILAMSPWYLPPGEAAPLVFGLPYWFAVSVAVTLVFSGVTAWACLRRWNLDEPEEERRAAEHAVRREGSHDGSAPGTEASDSSSAQEGRP